jgi:hypothetical protein
VLVGEYFEPAIHLPTQSPSMFRLESAVVNRQALNKYPIFWRRCRKATLLNSKAVGFVGNRRLCLIAPRRCVAGAILENAPSVVSNRRVIERSGSPPRP